MGTAQNVAEAALRAVAGPVARIASQFLEPQLVGSDGVHRPALTLLGGVRRAVLLGDFGTGKTTLLRAFAHRCASEFLGGASGARCPIWLPAPLIGTGRWSFEGLPDHEHALRRLLEQARCVLIVDGLDEAADPPGTAMRITALLRRYPDLDVLIATRPAAYPSELAELPGYSLAPLDKATILELIGGLAGGDKPKAQRFIDTMTVQYDMRELLSRPLLLNLAWHQTRGGEISPGSAEALYCDYFEDALSRLGPGVMSVAERGQILGDLAATLHVQGMYTLPLDDWYDRLSKAYPMLAAEEIARELRPVSFLIFHPEAVGFSHKSFLYFAIAYCLWRDPPQLLETVEIGETDRCEILRFAAWLSDDIGPLVDGCLKRNWLIEAASCTSSARAENGPLADYVVEQLRAALGTKILKRLSPQPSVEPEPDGPTSSGPALPVAMPSVPQSAPYAQLLSLLDACLDPSLPAHVRGREFESFAEALFGHCFDVHDRNRLTAFGEFDLALEINRVSAFWFSWGGDAFVECKNRRDSADVADINTFSSKVDLTSLRLAFFLSMSGFTSAALDHMNRLALKESKALLVPLTGEDVRRMLERQEPIEDFFKRAIRRIRDQQK